MVPMRGLKFKFEEGEKVLCYEPDPTKARVLYDSKVLEVNVNRDKKGRKAVEYLIHFQGWNSSWDRYVSEDHILKHTEENWKLQKELAEKAQLRPTAYLYRRDQKGNKGNKLSYRRSNKSEHSIRHRTTSATTSREVSPDTSSNYSSSLDKDESSRRKCVTDYRKKREKSVMEDEHLGNAYEDDDSDDYVVKHEIDSDDSREVHSDEVDEDHNACVEGGGDVAGDQDSEDFVDHNNTDNSECSTEDEASADDADDVSQSEEGALDCTEEENFPLEFTEVMRDILDLDNELIKNTSKLVILPANPNVVTILESYVREYAINQICGTQDNLRRKYRRRRNPKNGPLDIERINRSINICKEVADGVRIYFDFTLSGLLLYNEEKDQYEQTQNINIRREPDSRMYAAVDKDGENTTFHQSNVSYSCEPSTSHLDEVSYDNKCVSATGLKRLSRSHCHTDTEARDFTTAGSISKVDENESEKPVRNTESSVKNGSFFVLVVPKKETLSVERDNLSSINNVSKNKPCGGVPNVSSVEEMLHSRGCPPAALKFLSSLVLEWHLVPESVYTEKPPPPSLIYGAVHLARLFVKLPGLLHNTDMQARKLKLVLRHLQMILRYLEQNRCWFGEDFYRNTLEIKTE